MDDKTFDIADKRGVSRHGGPGPADSLPRASGPVGESSATDRLGSGPRLGSDDGSVRDHPSLSDDPFLSDELMPHDDPFFEEDSPPDGEGARGLPDGAECFDAAMWELESATHFARVGVADQWRVTARVLREAAAEPDPWAGPDPTADPLWRDPRGRSVGQVRHDRLDLAVRAATADIAVRFQLAETTVRTRAHHAEVLRERCPRTWASFLGGEIPERNAQTVAHLAASLPDDPDCWARFDDGVHASAATQTPGRFRGTARAVRERVHAESVEERHKRSAEDRGVWLTPGLDGMSSIEAYVPAAGAHALYDYLTRAARHLRSADDETRTLAQLRADVLVDLPTAEPGAAAQGTTAPAAAAPGAAAPAATAAAERDGGSEATSAESSGCRCGGRPRGTVEVSVAITVPVMTLLGHDGEPATLDGYGPIDLDTAKRLAGSATSFTRILTHPVSGTVLDVDRTSYRVPADLRRWIERRHPTCVFPGCHRHSRDCDLDHTTAWDQGGRTAARNLAPLCAPHHHLKHATEWQLDRDPDDPDQMTWTSPTGHRTDVDPAPF